MKRLIVLIYVSFISLCGFSQGGLMQRGDASDTKNEPQSLFNKQYTKKEENVPLGSGATLLIGFGTAYLLSKKKNSDKDGRA